VGQLAVSCKGNYVDKRSVQVHGAKVVYVVLNGRKEQQIK